MHTHVMVVCLFFCQSKAFKIDHLWHKLITKIGLKTTHWDFGGLNKI